MRDIIPLFDQNLNTAFRPPGQRLVVHYIVDGKVLCEAEHLLTVDTKFVQIPIPVIHQMARSSMR